MNVVADMVLDIAGSIGSESFYADVMRGVFGTVTSDDCQVIHYPGRGLPEYIVKDHTPERLRRLYREFCQFDPFYLDWRSRHRVGLRQLSDVQPPNYDKGGYSTGFYSVTGYADELGLMFPALVGSAIGVFVQRDRAYGVDEIGILSALFPVLRQFHAAHRRQLFRTLAVDHADADLHGAAIIEPSGRIAFASKTLRTVTKHEQAVSEALRCHMATGSTTILTCIGPTSVTDLGAFPLAPSARLLVFGQGPARVDTIDNALANFGGGLLSPREHQICCLTFAGYGNVHIADVLGITENTVKNLRKRLYLKMDVTSERELFALFIKHLRDSDLIARKFPV